VHVCVRCVHQLSAHAREGGIQFFGQALGPRFGGDERLPNSPPLAGSQSPRLRAHRAAGGGAARALAALTRTLRELNALLNRYPPPTEDEEAQPQALRAELARKIDGIIAQRPQRAAAEAQSAET
jgi:hypothetical protein